MLQSSSQFQGGPKSQFTYPNAQAPRPQRPQNSYQTPTTTQKPQIQKHRTYSNTQQQVQQTNQYQQPKFELNPQFKNQVQYWYIINCFNIKAKKLLSWLYLFCVCAKIITIYISMFR